jgi:hypothetical protein
VAFIAVLLYDYVLTFEMEVSSESCCNHCLTIGLGRVYLEAEDGLSEYCSEICWRCPYQFDQGKILFLLVSVIPARLTAN